MRAVYAVKGSSFEPSPGETQIAIQENPCSPLETFDACRAEINGQFGEVVLWANVNGPVRDNLEKGGENIGVSVPPSIFDSVGRAFIGHAIEITTLMPEPNIKAFLDVFSTRILHRGGPAVMT